MRQGLVIVIMLEYDISDDKALQSSGIGKSSQQGPKCRIGSAKLVLLTCRYLYQCPGKLIEIGFFRRSHVELVAVEIGDLLSDLRVLLDSLFIVGAYTKKTPLPSRMYSLSNCHECRR